mmetsp:Transcript_17756/g.32460  ORF Transcript_17756/g.32460 Transcript_17756/m.32460 type:complete len:142 (-) Transcript_17756:689-1114(-)
MLSYQSCSQRHSGIHPKLSLQTHAFQVRRQSKIVCNAVKSICVSFPKKEEVKSSLKKSTTEHRNVSCQAVFGLGGSEVAVILAVAAVAFGPNNLPDLGLKIGKTVRAFREQLHKGLEEEDVSTKKVLKHDDTENNAKGGKQ